MARLTPQPEPPKPAPRTLGDLHDVRDLESMIEELVLRASRGELRVSELLTLPDRPRELAGQALLNQREEHVATPAGVFTNTVGSLSPMHPELSAYRVTLEGFGWALDPENPNHDHLAYCDGHKVVSQSLGARRGRFGLEGPEQMGMIGDDTHRIPLDENHRCEVDLAAAWYLLRDSGEGICSSTPGTRRQRELCREVPRG